MAVVTRQCAALAYTQMEMSIGTPRHGWLPISMTLGSKRHDIRASNVLNDPFAELLAAAVWAVDGDYRFPVVPANVNQPIVTSDSHCVHLWLEPVWHTLRLSRVADPTHLQVTLFLNHDSVSRVHEDDLRNSEATEFDMVPVQRFATTVHNAVKSLCFDTSTSDFDQHWRRDVDRGQFDHLSALIT